MEKVKGVKGREIGEFFLKYALYIILLAILVAVSIIRPNFLEFDNILSILKQASTKGILALGCAGLIVLAGTDLSIGRVLGLSAAVTASLVQSVTYASRYYPNMTEQLPIIVPLLVAIVIAVVFSLINGFGVAYLQMHAFIITLGTQLIAYGANCLYIEGQQAGTAQALSTFDKGFLNKAAGNLIFSTYDGSIFLYSSTNAFSLKLPVWLVTLLAVVIIAAIVAFAIPRLNRMLGKKKPIARIIIITLVAALLIGIAIPNFNNSAMRLDTSARLVDETGERLTVIEQEIAGYEAELADVKTAIEPIKAEMAPFEDELTLLEEERDALTASRDEKSAELEAATAETDAQALQTEISELDAQISAKDEEIVGVNAELQPFADKYQPFGKEQQRLNNLIRSLKAEKKVLDAAIEGLTPVDVTEDDGTVKSSVTTANFNNQMSYLAGAGTVSVASTKIPLVVLYFAVLAAIMWVIWNKTRIGKNMFAVGGNPEAAAVSGVNVARTIMITYLMAGILYGIASFLEAARVQSVGANTGINYELDAISACVIGGVSFSGGVGTIQGVVIGAIILQAINFSLNFIGVNPYYQYIIRGLIIVLAVAIDVRKYIVKK